ncbi:MAG: hypothetical protein AAGD07_19390 [Planctomycetota bacterium]
MNHRVLVDTDPLVAILNANDSQHDVCVSALDHVRTPMRTSWPVLTEAAYLLRRRSDLVQKLLRSITEGFLEVAVLTDSDATAISDILKQYGDQGFQLADATLMHLS